MSFILLLLERCPLAHLYRKRHTPSGVSSVADLLTFAQAHPDLERPPTFENLDFQLRANASGSALAEDHLRRAAHLQNTARQMIDEALIANNVAALIFPSPFPRASAYAGMSLHELRSRPNYCGLGYPLVTGKSSSRLVLQNWIDVQCLRSFYQISFSLTRVKKRCIIQCSAQSLALISVDLIVNSECTMSIQIYLLVSPCEDSSLTMDRLLMISVARVLRKSMLSTCLARSTTLQRVGHYASWLRIRVRASDASMERAQNL